MAAESQGAVQALRFFPHVQLPRSTGSCLLYPVFEGGSQAEMQFTFLKSADLSLRDRILDVEMRKAEDVLHAYCSSFCRASDLLRTQSRYPIERFYLDRLSGDRRLKSFYRSGFAIAGTRMSLDKLCRLKLRINGKEFPCLRTIIDDATACLKRNRIPASLLAFGLGDGHGGNILVAADGSVDPALRLLYIDYEVSGYHSPLLDLAKPLYNDVFFRALYADCISSPPRLRAKLSHDTLAMNVTYGDHGLADAILGIKRLYLVQPLFQHAGELGFDLRAETKVLSSALFACGLLTRDFSRNSRLLGQLVRCCCASTHEHP